MANTNKLQSITVRATVILNIPDLDSTELTALYNALADLTDVFGGDVNVSTIPEPRTTPNSEA